MGAHFRRVPAVRFVRRLTFNASIASYCTREAVEIQFHIGWSKLAIVKFPSWAEIASCHCQIKRGNCKMPTVQRKMTVG